MILENKPYWPAKEHCPPPAFSPGVGPGSNPGFKHHLNLDPLFPDSHPQEKYSKQNRPSTLTFCISGFVQTYKSLRNMYLGAPGIFLDDQNSSVYIPVAESGGLVYVGLHCDPTDIDVKVGSAVQCVSLPQSRLPRSAVFIRVAVTHWVLGQGMACPEALAGSERHTIRPTGLGALHRARFMSGIR